MTNKQGHTPGPWRLIEHPHSHDWVGFIESDSIRNIAAVCNNYAGDDVVNARLIAAAPDLLAALELAFDYGVGVGIFGHAAMQQKGKQISEQIRAAIAKAKGE